MFKTLIATAVAATSLAVVAIPAQAATDLASCDANYSIAGSEDVITQALSEQGYTVDGVESWNGCVRAFVVKADGSLGMVFFEPGSLKLISEA